MLLSDRLCIIGLPRTGSTQLIDTVKLNFKDRNYTDLHEPFVYDLQHIITLDNNRLEITFLTNEQFVSGANPIDNIIKMFLKSDIDQSIICKLFLADQRLQSYYQSIIHTLKHCKFEFIRLKRRNLELQLLSWAIAMTTNQWSKTSIDNHDYHDIITISCFEGLKYFYKQIMMFDSQCQEHNITGPIIYYETMLEDLALLTDRNDLCASTILKVQRDLDDPYNRVKNRDSVKQFITELIK